MRSPHHHISDEGVSGAGAGAVTITLDTAKGRVEVSGPGIPTALLLRTDGNPSDGSPSEDNSSDDASSDGSPPSDPADSSRTDGVTPVGTRAAHRLSLTVGDTTALLVPARGRLSRRSYRVDATIGDITYRLVPHTVVESRLLRDGARLGVFQADGDASVIAVWSEGTVPGPVDISVGYALAAAFGTGAQHFLAALVDVGAEALPW